MKTKNDFEIVIVNPADPRILAAIQDERYGTMTTIEYLTVEEIKEKFNIDIAP